MGSSSVVAAWLLAAAAVGGCEGAPPDTESTRSSIIDGTVTDLRPEVGIFQSSTSRCTGTLIAPRHVLTAAHCVGFAGLDRGGSFTVVGSSPFPVSRTFSLGNNTLGSHDLAVAELSSAVPASAATPAQIAISTPPVGTLLTAVGFGSSSGFGTKRFRTYVRSGDDDITDSGDSGGPHFLGMLRDFGDIGLLTSYRFFIPLVSGHDSYADPPLHRDEILRLVTTTGTNGLCYRSHVANTGWLAAVCDGDLSGRASLSDDLQALQLWTARPGLSVCYRAHIARAGWLGEVCNSDMAGTVGQSLNIQAVALRLAASNGERLMAQAFVAGVGWQPPLDVSTGGMVGVIGRGMRAIKVWLE